MHIVISKLKIGKGIWKFNKSLFKIKDYLELVNKIIFTKKKTKYAIPVYSTEYVRNENESIKFNIYDDDFLEVIFLQIRGETIKFASYLKKQHHIEEKSMIVDIEYLESLSDKQNHTSILEDEKFKFEDLRKNQIKGHITRIQWLKDGEKPIFFL